MGCVPVTVTDGLMQPFEPELRWDTFAVDVRESAIPNMHGLLEGLSSSQVEPGSGWEATEHRSIG